MEGYWAAAWTASAQGPFPHGRETAQPALSAVFPDPGTGAFDQSFRMVVRPDIWGRQLRIRLSNAHGKNSIAFDGIFVGASKTTDLRNAMIMSVGIYLLTAILLVKFFGNLGLWIALTVFFILRGLTLFLYLGRIYKAAI